MSLAPFGPSALLTPANALTLGRLAFTPLLLGLILSEGASWLTLGVAFLLAATDGLDGHLARKQGTTTSGAFLDPLADKFLVLGSMICLVSVEVFWWLPVSLIAGRELAMSAYRTLASREGVSIPARRSAKLKTVVQEVAIGLALLPLTDDHDWVAATALWIAVALTLVTGAQYLIDARRRDAV